MLGAALAVLEPFMFLNAFWDWFCLGLFCFMLYKEYHRILIGMQ